MNPLLLLLFALTFAPEHTASAPSAPPEAFAGCWHDVDEPSRSVCIEPGKLRVLDHGELEITRVEYSADSVVRHVYGRKEIWQLAVNDGKLAVTANGKAWRLERIDARPDAMDPKPLALPKPAPIDSSRVEKLAAEFKTRRDQDQAVRQAKGDVAGMERVDADNTKWLNALVAEVGWIDAERFGTDAANAAFLIVQHSGDLPLMLAALPEIEKDVKAKRLDAQNFALLYDRTCVRLGQKQRYGTQLGKLPDDTVVMLALEDRANVESMRASIGLFTLAKYLDAFQQMTGAKTIVFEDDAKD